MPKFQETHPHPDTVQKHPLTAGDLMFLAELQRVLNTQDSMGNAAPRFWVIAQNEERPVPEGLADCAVVMDGDGDTVARTLEEFARWLDDGNTDAVTGCAYFNKSVKIRFSDGETAGAYGLEDAVEAVLEHGGEGIRVVWVEKRLKVIPDTLFLAHEDCEKHLENYGYNYAPDAHAYAMTAVRSPRFERLLKIIQETDWSAFEASRIQEAGS